MLDYRIENALLIDGSGRPGIPGSLGVKNGKIAALGRLDGETTAQRIDAKGRCLTPGFLDIHRHADAALFRPGFGRAELAQGLTTIVNGNCGLSLAPAPCVRRREIYGYLEPVTGLPDDALATDTMAAYLDAVSKTPLPIHIGMLAGGAAGGPPPAGGVTFRRRTGHFARAWLRTGVLLYDAGADRGAGSAA